MMSSYLLLLLLSAIWGASFLFIKIGVAEIGPLTFAMLRVMIGSVVLLLVLAGRKERLPRDRALWRHFLVTGLFNALIPFSLIAWGTQYIPSGLSAILNATTPIFTLILAALFGDERLRLGRVLGVLLGFGGIAVLTYPQLRQGFQANLWGELAVVLGSLSYAIAIVYARRQLTEQPPLTNSLGQLLMGSLLFIPFALWEQPWTRHPSWRAVGALLALSIVGTALAYLIYYRLIRELGATATALVTNIVPVFGIFWGWLILSERLSWHAFAALAMILGGAVLVNNLLARRRPRPVDKAPAGETA